MSKKSKLTSVPWESPKMVNKVYPNSNLTKFEIANGEHTIQTTTHDVRISTWRRFMVGPILFVAVVSSLISHASLLLYWTPYLREKLFPNDTVHDSSDFTSSCLVNKSSLAYKHNLIIQSEVSKQNMYIVTALGIPAFFSTVFFLTFSDHFGRKLVFILPLVGILFRCIFYALGMYLKLSQYAFLAVSVVEGLSGSFMIIFQAAFSYVADITTNDKKRSMGIAVIEISAGLGVVTSGILSGVLVQALGFVWPMVIAAGFNVLGLLLVIFVLPETVNVKKEEKRLRCTSVIHYTKTVLSFYVKQNSEGNRWKYHLCIWIFFLVTLTVLGRSSVEILYQIGSPFCWSPVKVGWFSSAKGLAQNVLGMGLIKVFQACMSEEVIAIVGTISSIASFIMEGLTDNDIMLYFVPFVGIGGVLTLPMIRAIMSKMTPASEQGAMFGGVAAVETVCSMVGSVMYNAIYSETLHIKKGFVFFVMAFICFTALILLIILWCLRRSLQSNDYTLEKEQNLRKE